MSKEQDFYSERSNVISALIEFIRLSDDLGRDVVDELNKVLWEAQKEYGLKSEDIKQLY